MVLLLLVQVREEAELTLKTLTPPLFQPLRLLSLRSRRPWKAPWAALSIYGPFVHLTYQRRLQQVSLQYEDSSLSIEGWQPRVSGSVW